MSNRAADLLLSVVVLAVTIRTFFFLPARVPTSSMAPTFVPGARIFVDRFTFNFRQPRLGECVVFLKSAVPPLNQAQPNGGILVKRLAGQGGDVLRLRDDHMLIINDREAVAIGGPFGRLYARRQTGSGTDGEFLGHLNQQQVQILGGPPNVAPKFPNSTAALRVRDGRLAVLGDASFASLDSRTWGDIPRESVIGRVREP